MRRISADGMVAMPRRRPVLTVSTACDKQIVMSDVLNVTKRGMERNEQKQEAVTAY
jgi:hypothetical protein